MNRSNDPGSSYWLPLLLTGVLIGGILVALLFVKFRVAPAATEELKVSYADMAAIVLSGVSVMVAILAVFVAALAIWGYSQFGKLTENASRRHLEKLLKNSSFREQLEHSVINHVSKQLSEGELRKIIVSRVDSLIVRDASAREEAAGDPRPEKDFTD